MHLNNKYQGSYDFDQLKLDHPAIKEFIIKNPNDEDTVNFSDPAAVKTLNQALLQSYYKIEHWDVPPGYLIPPIPSRSDYIHHLSGLAKQSKSDGEVCMLDIGTGASMIYQIVATIDYGWKTVGSDIDQVALDNAQSIIDNNPHLTKGCALRHQPDNSSILNGIIQESDYFDLVVCNPPFHSSAAKAQKANKRKHRNLNYKKESSGLNFGGQSNELWFPGGELAFIKLYIQESYNYRSQCGWFTSIVSNQRHIKSLQEELLVKRATDTRIIEMKHGQKVSRILIWTFRSST